MAQSFHEQRLFQISVDLRNRMAELQKLKETIRLAEASKLGAMAPIGAGPSNRELRA